MIKKLIELLKYKTIEYMPKGESLIGVYKVRRKPIKEDRNLATYKTLKEDGEVIRSFIKSRIIRERFF